MPPFSNEPDYTPPTISEGEMVAQYQRLFATELRKWWSFDNGQNHTHSYHSREDFIRDKLPELIREIVKS